MALVFNNLKSQLMNRFASFNNSPNVAANHITNSFDMYIQGIMNMGNGTYAGMPGISSLRVQLTDILARRQASKVSIANQISQAFDNCLKTLNTVYQTKPVETLGFSGFKSQNINLFNSFQNSGSEFGQKLAQNIDQYVKSSMITGVIPGSPSIPFSGPPK